MKKRVKYKYSTSYCLEAMEHPDVSGFEWLEVLDIRSRLAIRESLLSENDRSRLEKFDRRFFKMADFLLERISEVADMAEMRQGAHILPSHWWYLDEIILPKSQIAG